MQVQQLKENVGVLVTPNHEKSADDLDIETVKELYNKEGAILFRGFACDVAAFDRIGNRMSGDYWMDNTGSGSYRQAVDGSSDDTIQNVVYICGTDNQRLLPLHADRSYVKPQLPLMMFMCGRPSENGGQTTVCDGVKLLNALSDSTRALFESKKVKHIRNYAAGEWSVLFHTPDIGKVRQYCAENDLGLTTHLDGSLTTSLCRMEDDSRIPDEVVAEVNEVSERLTADIPWEAGDFVMCDNTRHIMHRRRPLDDPDREIYVRMCRSLDW